VNGTSNSGAVTNGYYTFYGVVTNGYTISVTFAPNAPGAHTIIATTGTGGSISPSGSVTVNNGADQTFTFTPATCYEIDELEVDATVVSPDSVVLGVGYYTFENVNANHTIAVTFKKITYAITASTGSNVNISPSGTVTVGCGDDQTFTFTPDNCYEIDEVLVDGSPVTIIGNTYTFTNVTEPHSISVTFIISQFTITATAGTDGDITPDGVLTFNCGDNQTFTFTPDPGYHIYEVLIDGVSNSSAIVSGTYTFTNITDDHTIHVTFEEDLPGTYIIAASSGANGNILPGGNVIVNHGNNQAFTFTPKPCYHIADVLVDGASDATAIAAGNYTFINVTDNHTIHVTFAPDTYIITATAGANGTITPSGNISVLCESNHTFTFTPDIGYDIDNVYVDGVSQPSAVLAGSYTFNNVNANHIITVTFKPVIAPTVCPAQVLDPANNIFYNVIALAGRCWYKENLRSTKYQDGSEVFFAQPYYHPLNPDSALYRGIFGLLYTYQAVFPNYKSVKALCPDGWRIPTSAEWASLNMYDIDDLRTPVYWLQPNSNTNNADFDLRGAGYYNGSMQRFEKLYGYVGYWSSDDPYTSSCLGACIRSNCSNIEILEIKLIDALSVRCIME
jgi:uncharacterized protein (TIGR02145 family)